MTRTSSGFRYLIFQRKDRNRKRWKRRRGSKRPWSMEWVEITRGQERRRYRTFQTRGAAQAEADRLDGLARVAAGLADDFQLKTYAAAWLHRIEPNLAHGTIRVYGSAIDHHILPWRGEAWLRDIRPGEVKDFLSDKLRAGLAKKTVANLRGVLHALFEEAVADGIIPANPAKFQGRSRALKLTPTRAERRQKLRAMTAAQLGAFLEAAALVRPDRLLRFRLMAMTGLRPGEAAAVQWDDLDLMGGSVLIRRSFTGGRLKGTKTGAERSVDIGQGIASDLQRWDAQTKVGAMASGRQRSAFVFPSGAGGPVDGNYIERDFRAVVLAAGLPPHFTPHCLRHTYASLQLVRGVSIYYVQQQLGHATIGQTVDLYGSWLPAGNREHADGLEREVAGRPATDEPDSRTTGAGGNQSKVKRTKQV